MTTRGVLLGGQAREERNMATTATLHERKTQNVTTTSVSRSRSKEHKLSPGYYFGYITSRGQPVRAETDPSDWERNGKEHQFWERGYEFYTKKLPR